MGTLTKTNEIFYTSSYCWTQRDAKKYEELWNKIRNVARSVNNSSGSYQEKYMKIKFHSDDLPLKKTLALYNIIIIVTSAFHEGNKYYPHKHCPQPC